MPAGNRPRGATALPADSRSLPQLRLPAVRLPRAHLLAGAAIIGVVALGLALTGDKPPAPPAPAVDTLAQPTAAPSAPSTPIDTFAQEPAAPTEPSWHEQTVKSGDNLSLIFKRAGFTTRDVYAVVSQSEHGKELAKIYPGQTIAFQAADNGELAAVRHVKSGLESVTYRLGDSGFVSERTTREPIAREASTTGVITSSLFMAGKEAGLSHNMIMEMANIFGGVIDFVGDPRSALPPP